MKLNAYTVALDAIHAPESAVERAIRGAKARAAARASAQLRTRYAAAAASLVLASAAGGTLYYLYGGTPPAAPVAPTAQETRTVPDATAAPTLRVKETETATQPATLRPTEAVAEIVTETIAETLSDTPAETSQPATDAPQETAPAEPTVSEPTAATESPAPTEGPPVPDDPDIDPALVNADGKVYFTISSTATDRFEGEENFTDEHLYCIVTKFGRTIIKPLSLLVIEPFNDVQSGITYYYLYNSDGTVLESWTSP